MIEKNKENYFSINSLRLGNGKKTSNWRYKKWPETLQTLE